MTDQLPDYSPIGSSNSPVNDGQSTNSGEAPDNPNFDKSMVTTNKSDNNGNNEEEQTLKKRTLFSRDLWNLRKKKLKKEEIDPLDSSEIETPDVGEINKQEQISKPIEPRLNESAPIVQEELKEHSPAETPEQQTYGKLAPVDDNKYFAPKVYSPPVISSATKANSAIRQSPAASTSWEMAVDQAESPKVIGEKKKLLYVEDNPDNRLLIKRILLFEGYDIMFAENAIEALVAADDHTFDLILMDINLPDIDGYALTSKLRQIPKFNSVPIIALTANVMKGDRERSLEAGCDGYIQKPINIDTLPGQIKEYLVAR